MANARRRLLKKQKEMLASKTINLPAVPESVKPGISH